MSYIPGTEYSLIPHTAPSAAHGRHYKKYHRARATYEKDFRFSNILNQTPAYARNTYASIAVRNNFLNQQRSSSALNELSRIGGILDQHRQYRLSDGVALETRQNKLEKRLAILKPQPLAGPDGLYAH